MTDAFDDVAQALSHPYRRSLLVQLHERNPLQPLDREVLETTIAPSSNGDGGNPERARIEMHHTHLPKLAESGYVDWDQESGVAVKGPNWEEIAPVLELLEDHQHDLPVEWP